MFRSGTDCISLVDFFSAAVEIKEKTIDGKYLFSQDNCPLY
jgi:hypothetical protein